MRAIIPPEVARDLIQSVREDTRIHRLEVRRSCNKVLALIAKASRLAERPSLPHRIHVARVTYGTDTVKSNV